MLAREKPDGISRRVFAICSRTTQKGEKPFLFRRFSARVLAPDGEHAVPGRLDRRTKRVVWDVFLSKQDAGAFRVRGRDFFDPKVPTDRVVDVGFAHPAPHPVDLYRDPRHDGPSPFLRPQAPPIGQDPHDPQEPQDPPRFRPRTILTTTAHTIPAKTRQMRIVARFSVNHCIYALPFQEFSANPYTLVVSLVSADADFSPTVRRVASRYGRNSWNRIPASTSRAATSATTCGAEEMPPVNSSPKL